MKKKQLLLFFCFLNLICYSQTRKVAILDFENISRKADYNSLGKALSAMLITDLKNNIHPKKIEFFERSQLNNLLVEQKLQKSKNFDPKTAVNFGKLSGVNFVIVGSVFILDGNCNFSAKMIDVETSKIILAKYVSGKIEAWLQLKSQLADAISIQLNNPIKIDPTYKTPATSLATINQYTKVLTAIDQGDAVKAEQLNVLFEETTPEFKYFSDIKEDIQKLKLRVTELENVTDVLTDAFELGNKAENKSDYKNTIKYFERYINTPGDKGYIENKKLYAFAMMSVSYFQLGDYENALKNAKNASKIYAFYPLSNEVELMGLIKLNKKEEAKQKYNFIVDSLTFDNELQFQRQNRNDLLTWENIYSFYYGLRTQKDSKDLCYSGIRKSGYGSPVENEIKINSLLQENKIDIRFLIQSLSQYERIEKKLMSLNDPRAFYSNQLVNFYALSYDYALKLYNNKDFDRYNKHLEKEIKRMENFGIPSKNGSIRGDQREAIPESYMNNKEYDKINQTIKDCGLDNSLKAFYEDFPLIYGKFIFDYLIQLISDGRTPEATALYRTLLTPYVKEKESYFYNRYWDILLGLRAVSDDVNSRENLSTEEQAKRLNIKIEKLLKKSNIPLNNFERIKNEKILVKPGSKDVEIDQNIISDKVIWSKNIGLISDGIGNMFQLAKKENMRDYSRDSIAAYCFYDYESQNGHKYGKLYNYWAMKLLYKNPPSGWRIANQFDFSNYLKLETSLKIDNKGNTWNQKEENNIEDFLSKHEFKKEAMPFILSGKGHTNDFYDIDEVAWFWTGENLSKDSIYQKLIKIHWSGEFQFSDYNCKECFFSIRLVKSK